MWWGQFGWKNDIVIEVNAILTNENYFLSRSRSIYALVSCWQVAVFFLGRFEVSKTFLFIIILKYQGIHVRELWNTFKISHFQYSMSIRTRLIVTWNLCHLKNVTFSPAHIWKLVLTDLTKIWRMLVTKHFLWLRQISKKIWGGQPPLTFQLDHTSYTTAQRFFITYKRSTPSATVSRCLRVLSLSCKVVSRPHLFLSLNDSYVSSPKPSLCIFVTLHQRSTC